MRRFTPGVEGMPRRDVPSTMLEVPPMPEAPPTIPMTMLIPDQPPFYPSEEYIRTIILYPIMPPMVAAPAPPVSPTVLYD